MAKSCYSQLNNPDHRGVLTTEQLEQERHRLVQELARVREVFTAQIEALIEENRRLRQYWSCPPDCFFHTIYCFLIRFCLFFFHLMLSHALAGRVDRPISVRRESILSLRFDAVLNEVVELEARLIERLRAATETEHFLGHLMIAFLEKLDSSGFGLEQPVDWHTET
ncbi:unnamed protein product [Protopolystoma xenopodis]|uniref:Uncharacterized protein n=1 Tax=Protopolystoma xenopodis TaxID=117903 RepID=A0A448WKF4_9PLAT|nr:unnamed protein product [Protopolystoma xenopodis]